MLSTVSLGLVKIHIQYRYIRVFLLFVFGEGVQYTYI